jgi:DNA-binding NtrC family response regulator
MPSANHPPSARYRIVIFEDEPVAMEFCRRALESKYSVDGYPCVEDGRQAIAGADLILSDWEMPGLGGDGLLRLLEQMEKPPSVVIISGLSLFDQRLKEVRDKDLPFLPKPLTMKNLLTMVALHLPTRTGQS